MRKLPVSWAASRFEKQMLFKMTEWKKLKEILSKPKRTAETYAEYIAWDKERQLSSKDVGYYIVGEFIGNLRHNVEFKRRGTITLDIDYPGPDFEARLELCFGPYEYFWHTSRKSSPDAPRIRVHLPLSRDVTDAEEHEALTRLVASWYDIQVVDKVSFVPAQMMFFPSVCADGVFQCSENAGQWLDVDQTLMHGYIDWRERAEWPRAQGEIPPETRKEKVDSPLTKPGIIGAFCRSYSISRVLEEIIPGTYEPAGDEGKRWRYYAAEGGGGAIVYDNDTILYSHHTNHDPAAGRSVNAFDLVRIHKFGALDAEVFEDLKPTDMPSFVAMREFASELPDVVREINAVGAFEGMDESQGEAPTARITPRPAQPSPAASKDGTDASAEGDSSALDILPEAGPGRLVASRAKIRAMIEDCTQPDALVDSVLPALAGAALDRAMTGALLKDISERHGELTGRPLDMRDLRGSLADLVKRMAVVKPKNGHAVESELIATDENGVVLNTVRNMKEWLSCGAFDMSIVFDEFCGVPMMSPPGKDEWREITPGDFVDIRMAMERDGFKTFGGGNELIKMAVDAVARGNKFDSAQRWASMLLWDGTPRIDRFYITYLGAPDNDYVRLCGAYTWTALASRLMKPGCKADMVPVLFGPQGLRKSSSVEAIAPSREFFGILSLKDDDAGRGRKMVGKLVMELGELRGLLNTNDEEGIKTFFSAGFDEWKPLYHERTKKHFRRCLFMATTDKIEFLSDISGNRRYLPVKITRTDVEGIVRDREQFWAEAIERAAHRGVEYQVERVAGNVHQEHMMSDLWDGHVLNWLDQKKEVAGFEIEGDEKNGDTPFRSAELLQAIGVQVSKSGRSEQIRIARILQRFGYESAVQWFKGKAANVWVKKT